MRRHAGRSWGRSRGQSLVEFALVIPIFLLILFGMIDIGRLVYINNSLSEGAREAARWGSVQLRSRDDAGRKSVETYATGSMAAVPDPTAKVTCQDGVDLSDETVCGSGDILVVEVSSPVTMFTPIIAQIVGSRTYTATSRVAVSY